MRKAVLVVVLGFLFGVFSTALVAGAGSSHYLSQDWLNNPNLRIDSSMPAPFNTTSAMTEMENGRLGWNGVSGASIDFILQSRIVDMSSGVSISNVPTGYVWVTDENLTGDVFGVTVTAGNSTDITKALSQMDSSRSNWHISTSTGMAKGKIDLRSGALHELGHAVGFNQSHITNQGTCTTWSGINQTMCPNHISAPSNNTVTQYRTLEPHEATDHANNY